MTPIAYGFIALLVVSLVYFAREVVRGVRAYWLEHQGLVTRHWVVPRPADADRIPLLDVAFFGRDGTPLRGWYVPGRGQAVVVLCAGSEADRSAMLADARNLSSGGLGVLVFDWPGRGESGGVIQFGATERAALQGALDYLVMRAGGAALRIGALGFSMGGYTVAQVASFDRRLSAVLLAGTPTDIVDQTRAEYAPVGRLAQYGALLAIARAGVRVHEMRPIDVAREIAPTPLVVVAGTDDVMVPASMSRQLYDAAREPKEYWLITGAGHGDYASHDREYDARVRAFFERALTSRQ
jgi:uncharacterized protein